MMMESCVRMMTVSTDNGNNDPGNYADGAVPSYFVIIGFYVRDFNKGFPI